MIEIFEQWTSVDGIVATIRPTVAADLELERAFVDGLSTTSAYQRLFSQRRLSEDELQRFTDIDYQRDMALIATVGPAGHEHQIGVARYIRESNPSSAEFAIVLSDDWQGRGLGKKLLSNLIALAKVSAVMRLNGSVLSENAPMITLARKLGFETQKDPRGAQVTLLTLRLNATADNL
jgi:acetyltransferase